MADLTPERRDAIDLAAAQAIGEWMHRRAYVAGAPVRWEHLDKSGQASAMAFARVTADAVLAALPDDSADLDAACALLDDARHEAAGSRTKLAEALNPILFGSTAHRLLDAWQQRRRRALDPTPAHVRHHERSHQ